MIRSSADGEGNLDITGGRKVTANIFRPDFEFTNLAVSIGQIVFSLYQRNTQQLSALTLAQGRNGSEVTRGTQRQAAAFFKKTLVMVVGKGNTHRIGQRLFFDHGANGVMKFLRSHRLPLSGLVKQLDPEYISFAFLRMHRGHEHPLWPQSNTSAAPLCLLVDDLNCKFGKIRHSMAGHLAAHCRCTVNTDRLRLNINAKIAGTGASA